MDRRQFISSSVAGLVLSQFPRISFAQVKEELLNKRTFTAKHFDIGDGRFLGEFHIGHIHYRDGALKDGKFQDIDTTLEYNPVSKLYTMTKASYEAEIGLYGEVRFHNVDHSLEMRLPNPFRVEAKQYLGSVFGKLGKGLIWENILQEGGHQIVEARNNSLAKIIHFDVLPLSNVIEFEVIGSQGLKFLHRGIEKNPNFVLSDELNFKGSSDRMSWIRKPQAWNHRGERVDIELQFFNRDAKLWMTKTIPQEFIDRTFTELGAWLETDTTDTFFAGTGDAYYERSASAGEAWSVLRGGAQTFTSSTGAELATRISSENSVPSNKWYWLVRSQAPFDYSSLPDGASISDANVQFYGKAKNDGLAINPKLSLDKATATGYAIANYNNIHQAPAILYGDFTLEVYNSFSLNSTGISNINKTGTTRWALRTDYDLDNVEPTWSTNQFSNHNVYSAEATGTSKDPKSEVTYTTGSPLRRILMGVG